MNTETNASQHIPMCTYLPLNGALLVPTTGGAALFNVLLLSPSSDCLNKTILLIKQIHTRILTLQSLSGQQRAEGNCELGNRNETGTQWISSRPCPTSFMVENGPFIKSLLLGQQPRLPDANTWSGQRGSRWPLGSCGPVGHSQAQFLL